MEKDFSLIDGQMLCNIDQLHALENFSISIYLSQVATSYLFGQLSFDIMFILLVLYTLLILDSSLSPSRTKKGRHFTLDMDGEMTCS